MDSARFDERLTHVAADIHYQMPIRRTFQLKDGRGFSEGRGRAIVNVASSVARRASPGAAIYSSSKAAVVSITQAAAAELIAQAFESTQSHPEPC